MWVDPNIIPNIYYLAIRGFFTGVLISFVAFRTMILGTLKHPLNLGKSLAGCGKYGSYTAEIGETQRVDSTWLYYCDISKISTEFSPRMQPKTVYRGVVYIPEIPEIT